MVRTMDRKEEIALRRLQRLANDETDMARGRFRRGIEGSPPTTGLSVLSEAVGKVNRCFNKLDLAVEPEIIEHWNRELKTEMIKAHSIMDRLYLTFVEGNIHGNGHQVDDGHGEFCNGVQQDQPRV